MKFPWRVNKTETLNRKITRGKIKLFNSIRTIWLLQLYYNDKLFSKYLRET